MRSAGLVESGIQRGLSRAFMPMGEGGAPLPGNLQDPARRSSLLVMKAALAKEVASLSPDQRLELIGEIWNTLAAAPESVPVPEAQRVELEHRVAAYRAAPGEVLSLEQVEKQVDERLRRRA